MPAEITLSSKRPTPPSADFALYIDFKKGVGSASRVFQAAQDFIAACELLDRSLCDIIDSHIEPVMVLEEIETGSLKIWLRNVLKSSDDEGLKALDWKPLVGKYLVRAKYAVLSWIDDESATPKSLPDLAKELRRLAAETDVRQLPDYSNPRPQDLIDAIGKFQTAKDALEPGDLARFVSDEGDVEFNLSIRWGPEDLTAMAIGETIQLPPTPMILAVKRPDYLGESQWDFRHGKAAIRAKIEDTKWLRRFQERQVDVRPGDALKCLVQIEHSYGYDNELLLTRYLITEVMDVLADRSRQTDLFEDDSGSESDPTH